MYNYINNSQALAKLLLTRRESISVLNKATRPSLSDKSRAEKRQQYDKMVTLEIYLHVLFDNKFDKITPIDKALLLLIDMKCNTVQVSDSTSPTSRKASFRRALTDNILKNETGRKITSEKKTKLLLQK